MNSVFKYQRGMKRSRSSVRKGKQREVQHAVAIEVKDAEIADLNKSILYLLDENDQLSAELDEIHNITQRHISNSQNVSPRIWMKRLKRKSRRGTEDLQFACKRKKQKLTSEDENEEGPSDKDVINVDNIPPGPVSLPNKPVPIKNLRSYGVHCLLSTEDQQRISQIWSEAYSSTCIWSGSEMGSSIYVDDIRQLIVNSSISGSVIDAYSEILMRDQSKMVGELQSDGTQMTNETSYVFTCGLLSTIIPKSREERLRLLDKWMPRDNEEGSWKFYNSRQLRTGVDRSCEAATQLKRQVESYWKSKTKGLFMTHECKPIQLMEDIPQQGHSTLDCGIVVCYVIRQYFRNEPISSQLPEGGCQKMRSDILHAFLSDENNSWSLERQMNEDDEMKCTNSCIQ
ncbi:hypothetical protein RHSIM_Rhsim13G0177800 [Rhododendron simsii]|uniref:Ubiquitin-like protease family profile domain-containing protein n=1 Tax=Rhododendron simsii TaxID=118357 RepID=A0A834G0R0_RHOSS|nr:hypothetical protein RHSIM_Rhsim13G0177800 [Rhododendron simsii]